MHRRVLAAAVAATAFVMSAASVTAQTPPAETFGVWRNPKDNVRVEIRPCGDGACGTIVWASPKAQAKARDAGTANLVGTQVFRNLELGDNGVWRGKVFVPELRRSFSGTAEPVDTGKLRAKGCVVGGLFCKSQVWTKVAT